jgi:hypothetical protein
MNIYSLPEKVEVMKMPNKDGTGPEGKGPRTGRQMGDCEGAEGKGLEFGSEGKGPRTRREMGNYEDEERKGIGPNGKGRGLGLGKRYGRRRIQEED